ncbi:hypothetical protein SK128_004168 [Halocaridina rubra]|uniref:C-type lectin domain-containing protein n=1 Tax=Halocaridina rubra TaxID=373956 RepID=A0AAN9FW90_HALRR
MHDIERTSWFLHVLYVLVLFTTCFGAPPEEVKTSIVNTTTREAGQIVDNEEKSLSYPEPSILNGTSTPPPVHPIVPAVNTGPGNYLETRRVQLEGRLQRVETQVNLLLDSQRKNAESKHNNELESNTAIQYGLNCERGDNILVCFMRKLIVIRKELSGIHKDISDLGKRVVYLEMNDKENSSSNATRESDKEKGQEAESKQSKNGNSTTEANPEEPEVIQLRHDPFCPPRYDRVGSLCYYVVKDRTGGVTSSRDFCQNHGGYLARPRDSLIIHDLANHMTHMYDTVTELWVDGQYKTEEETWRWKDGQQIDSSIWGLPDTPSKYHRTGTCVLLKKELNYLAMPQDCGYHYYFVCQAEPTKDVPSL